MSEDHQRIINLGWAWHGTCNCQPRADIYKKGNLKLKRFHARGNWELRIRNRIIARTNDNSIIDKIEQYEQMAVH